jgi:hypothetical protein
MENEQVYVVLYGMKRSVFGSIYGVYKTQKGAEEAKEKMERSYPEFTYWYEIWGVS